MDDSSSVPIVMQLILGAQDNTGHSTILEQIVQLLKYLKMSYELFINSTTNIHHP